MHDKVDIRDLHIHNVFRKLLHPTRHGDAEPLEPGGHFCSSSSICFCLLTCVKQHHVADKISLYKMDPSVKDMLILWI